MLSLVIEKNEEVIESFSSLKELFTYLEKNPQVNSGQIFVDGVGVTWNDWFDLTHFWPIGELTPHMGPIMTDRFLEANKVFKSSKVYLCINKIFKLCAQIGDEVEDVVFGSTSTTFKWYGTELRFSYEQSSEEWISLYKDEFECLIEDIIMHDDAIVSILKAIFYELDI